MLRVQDFLYTGVSLELARLIHAHTGIVYSDEFSIIILKFKDATIDRPQLQLGQGVSEVDCAILVDGLHLPQVNSTPY